MAQNENVPNGTFKHSISYPMAKTLHGITTLKRGVQSTADGREKHIFVAYNSKKQEVMRGLISEKLATVSSIPTDAYFSEIEFTRPDGTMGTCNMLHRAASQVELADFMEEEEA